MLNRNRSDDDSAAAEQAQDDRGRRLLREARGLRGLSPEQVRRIAARLEAPVAPGRARWLAPAAVTLALLLSAGTALAWATGTLQRLPVVRALFSARMAPRAGRPATVAAQPALRSTGAAVPGEPAPAAGDGEMDGPAPSTPAGRLAPGGQRRAGLAQPALMPRRHSMAAAPSSIAAASPRTDAPAAIDSPIVREGDSFAGVLRRWRRDHDGRAALSVLDVHDRNFAGGQMVLESRLLRVEILLSEHRDQEALAILDGLLLGQVNVPRGRELLTVRGELRIRAGRCEDGRADLSSIAGGSDALAQRARNALTHCR